MTENDVKTVIVEYLQRTGWLVLRVNSGAAVGNGEGNRRFFWFVKWFVAGAESQTAGVADILAFKAGYAPLAIEAKKPGRESRVSEVQKKFLTAWAEHGGVWAVCSDLDDLLLVAGIKKC